MARSDKDYPYMSHARVIKHTLDDGTVLAVVVTGLKSELPSEQRTITGYKVRVTDQVIHASKSSGPPGRGDYTAEELGAHRGDERFVVDEKEEWRGRNYITDEMVGIMTQVRLERVWETDLFDKNGKPVYKLEYRPHA